MGDVLRNRIQKRLQVLNLTPRAASLKAGLGPDLIRDLLRRPENRLLSDSLHRIALALGTTSSYLLGESEEETTAEKKPARKKGFAAIEHLAVAVELGGRVTLLRDGADPLFWRQDWVARHLDGEAKNGRWLAIAGDTYVGGLGEGDTVCIDIMRIDPARDPGVYCLYDGASLIVRRLQMLGRQKIRMLSENERYPSYELDGAAVQILGRVVWRAGGM
jgi:phage repressor protein C with HTH and peptisase S24 domain